MDKPAEICETYQLKWSSYNSYIHSCIATSLHSDSYADVALVTVDGHQIMAHRYILSYSSQYFNQILKFQPKVTTALPLMIVMPPEIDYKSLKVLVRYMYSGEAKVSKEILNTVLKGGDILQIKGLYRENDDQERNARAKKTQQPQKGVNSATSTVVTNPVAVQQSTNANPVATQSATNKPTQNVLHKSSHASTSAAATVPSSSTEKNTSSTSQPQQTTQTVTTTTGRKFLIVQKPKDQQTYLNQRPKVLNFTIMQPFDVAGQNPKEPVTILNKDIDQNKSDGKADQTKKKDDAPVTVKTEPSPMKDTSLQYLVIKDEPVEWNEADMEFIDSKEILEDMTIKSENTENYETESNSNEGETLFSPLTCELCTETFTIPAEWVRHVQTHTDMLPAKRRRRDSPGDSFENNTFPELMCDMCQKSFPTPAEWVHHIQDIHTEFELHLSNKTIEVGKSAAGSATTPADSPVSSGGETAKKCTDCDKSFPSHASMVIHRRRHTGEKPYTCEYCNKHFNVKSNLLRHLRTLHNKIINSTDIENKDTSDNSN